MVFLIAPVSRLISFGRTRTNLDISSVDNFCLCQLLTGPNMTFIPAEAYNQPNDGDHTSIKKEAQYANAQDNVALRAEGQFECML